MGQGRPAGIGLAVLGAVLFSLKGVAIKLAFAEGMSVDQILTLRMAFSLPFFLVVGAFAYARRKAPAPRRAYLLAAGLGILSYYVSSYLNFSGLQYVSAQLERLILYIYPTMVAVLAFIFLGERATLRHLLALGLAYGGVLILFGSEVGGQSDSVWLGAGLIFAGAFLYAIYVTASRGVIAMMGSALFTAFAMSAASLVFLAQAGLSLIGKPVPSISPGGLGLTLFLSVFCTVAPSFMIAEAIHRLGPGPTSAIGGIGPVVAAWAAVAVLGEPFGWPHIIAMGLTIIGVGLLSSDRRQSQGR
jgi:drug/metabolite transporter (DMT)-like permease